MRIAQIVTQLEAGGAQRIAVLIARELRRRGHDIETWFLYRKRDAFASEPSARVLLDTIPTARDYPRIAARLRTRIVAFRPEALITHTHYANILGLLVGASSGVRTRIAVQHSPVGANPSIARLTDLLFGSTSLYTFNVVVSDSVAHSVRHYPRLYRNRIRRVYNGIPPVREVMSRAVTRERWGIPPAAPLVVNVGRLSAPKNQATLVRAMSMLPDTHLAIVGDGELRDEIIRLVKEQGLLHRVHLLRELPWEDAMSVVASADVFAFPSVSEAMPVALVEAMALGCPIVANDIPAVRETLGESGLILPSLNPDTLAAALRGVLESDEAAYAMGESARVRSRDFSLDRMIDAYERLLLA